LSIRRKRDSIAATPLARQFDPDSSSSKRVILALQRSAAVGGMAAAALDLA